MDRKDILKIVVTAILLGLILEGMVTAGGNISLAVTANVTSLPPEGGSVTFFYHVTNNGNVNLTDVFVNDDKCAPVNCPGTTLTVATSMRCNCTMNVTETTVEIASVTGWNENKMVGKTATITVTVKTPDCYNDSDCSDGKWCNGKETCQNGVCHAGVTVDCNDNINITDDVCNETIDTCVHLGKCDLGFNYNQSKCEQIGECVTDANCTAMNDACNVGKCNYSTFNCYKEPKVDGTNCSDGLFCNGEETCQNGVCHAGVPPNCSDSIACTDDFCSGSTCVHIANTGCMTDTTPNVSLAVTANVTSLPINGGQVMFFYHVTNNGNVNLTDVFVNDDKCAPVNCPGTTLTVATSMECNCTAAITQTRTEIASVTAWNKNQMVGKTATVTVTVATPSGSSGSSGSSGGGCRCSGGYNGEILLTCSRCSDNQICDNSTHSCKDLICSEGSYPKNHTCQVNITYCPINTKCKDNERCDTTSHSCQKLNCSKGFYSKNHICQLIGNCTTNANCTAMNDACNVGKCNYSTFNCYKEPKIDGTNCSDNSFCNGEETCQNGVCHAGVPPNCSDSFNCTEDFCNTSCVHIINNSKCDAGQYCNQTTGCQPIENKENNNNILLLILILVVIVVLYLLFRKKKSTPKKPPADPPPPSK